MNVLHGHVPLRVVCRVGKYLVKNFVKRGREGKLFGRYAQPCRAVVFAAARDPHNPVRRRRRTDVHSRPKKNVLHRVHPHVLLFAQGLRRERPRAKGRRLPSCARPIHASARQVVYSASRVPTKRPCSKTADRTAPYRTRTPFQKLLRAGTEQTSHSFNNGRWYPRSEQRSAWVSMTMGLSGHFYAFLL